MDIVVKLLGTPGVSINGSSVLFPFKKVEALFYYLVIEDEATREELVNLLWPDIDEEAGRKNLRNAIYQLKKAFRGDILISPNKSITALNKDLNIKTDIYSIEKEEGVLSEYPGDFLQGFSIKEAEYFEDWMSNTREYIRDLYKKNLYIKVESNELKDSIEDYIKQIILIDPLDERAYRVLMEYYIECDLFNRAIDTYNRLTDVLERELGIAPDTETSSLYERVLKLKNIKKSSANTKSKAFFYGREKELKRLLRNFYEFSAGGEYKSLFIVGEAGVGKTGIKNKFINLIEAGREFYLLDTNCYKAEEGFALKPWNNVFTKLIEIIKNEGIEIPDLWKGAVASLFPVIAGGENPFNLNPLEGIDSLKFQYAEEAVRGVLKKVCSNKKTILVFEDMQWMDNMSLSLLKSVLLHMDKDLFFIGTSRNEYVKRVEDFTSTMIRYNKVEKLEIQRFSRKEVGEFINYAVQESTNDELIEKIYQETEGNAFFLVEMLNSIRENGKMDIMSSKMQDILKSRFLDVSKEGKKLLQIISIFFDEAPLDIIVELTGKDELDIIDISEELQRRFILKENENKDGISLTFTHQKLREFIYMELSIGKRRVLHNKIGLLLEKNIKGARRDMLLYPKLIYHFRCAKNREKALKYTIKNADIYLDFSHELFPVLNSPEKGEKKFVYINEKQVDEYFSQIEQLLAEIDGEGENHEIKEYKTDFYHMYGRYYIRQGEYVKGIEYIQMMIKNSIDIKNYEYAIKGYRQMIYCGIQTSDICLMNKYIKLAIPLAEEMKNKVELGILLRLNGLVNIMSENYKEAERLLKRSIDAFTIISMHDERYVLNIAAAYNYIGDIRRYSMDYPDALKYYDLAIEITKDKKVLTGLTIFYTNAGQAAFEMGDYIRARNYFEKAIEIFDIMDTMWNRSIAEGYMALLDMQEGKRDSAKERLNKAWYYAERMKSPKEFKLLSNIQEKIKSM